MSCRQVTGFKWNENKNQWELARGECAFNLDEVRKELQVEALDGPPSVREASFHYAIDPYESQPGKYNIFYAGYLNTIRARMHRVHNALMTKGVSASQWVWVTLDPKTRGKIPKLWEGYVKNVIDNMEGSLRFLVQGDRTMRLNVRFDAGEHPPIQPHATVVMTQSLALKNLLEDFPEAKSYYHPEMEGSWLRTGVWTPGKEDVGNVNLGGITFARLDTKTLNDGQAADRVIHELGHLWGLEHSLALPTYINPQTGVMKFFLLADKGSEDRVTYPIKIMGSVRPEEDPHMKTILGWGGSALIYLRQAVGEIDITPKKEPKKPAK